MADRKLLLHELLQEDQEPFQLTAYIADKHSQFNKPSSSAALQLRKRRTIALERSRTRGNSICRHACFLTLQSSPDVRKSPISPAKSPCKSPSRAVLLHIPSRTAALLLEAAMRIQKQQKPKSGAPTRSAGFGLLGSFVKRLKDRRKSKKRGGGFKALEVRAEENASKSRSLTYRRINSPKWTEYSEAKSMDFETSTSSYASEWWSESHFVSSERRFCVSPFRFSFHKSPSSNGRGTPVFCSPAASPSRRVDQDQENFESQDLDRGDGEEKEQFSPVSVLDPVFQEDDGPLNGCNDGDNYECSYANVQRAKEHLLYRLRRFEKLAELDPMELEKKLHEESEEEDNPEQGEDSEDNDDKLSPPHKKPGMDTLVTDVFNQRDLQSIPADMKRLVCDLIMEEKNATVCSREAVVGRICKRLDSWKEVELDTIDMMVGLDMMKKERDEWTKFVEQVEATAAEMGIAVSGLLVDELLEELCYMDKVIGLLVR